MVITVDSLDHIKDSVLPGFIAQSAETIFNINHDELTKSLDPKTPTLLIQIRKELLIRFSKICPQFTPCLAISRPKSANSKEALVQDILMLGNSIIAKKPVEHINFVYTSVPIMIDEFDLSALDGQPALKATIGKLVQTSVDNKLKVDTLEARISCLENEKGNLENRLAILEARLGLGDPNVPISVEPVKDMVEPEIIDVVGPQIIDHQQSTPINSEPKPVKGVEPRPVIGVIKTTHAFIGNVQAPCSRYDIQQMIKNNTSVNPSMSDIHEIKTRSESLAFKVTVPKNKFHGVTYKSAGGKNIMTHL